MKQCLGRLAADENNDDCEYLSGDEDSLEPISESLFDLVCDRATVTGDTGYRPVEDPEEECVDRRQEERKGFKQGKTDEEQKNENSLAQCCAGVSVIHLEAGERGQTDEQVSMANDGLKKSLEQDVRSEEMSREVQIKE